MDPSKYSTVVFVDTMVILEGKPLEALPWHELHSGGSVLILVVPQVMREADKRKRDGRLAIRARAFNRLVRPAALSGVPVPVLAGGTTVDIALAAYTPIPWDQFSDLDQTEGDSRVIAEVLCNGEVPLERKVFLSHDNYALAMASRHGLRVVALPDSWLMDPEPSPSERELAKMKSRVKDLEADQPKLRISLSFDVQTPLLVCALAPLNASEANACLQYILQGSPRISQGGFPVPSASFDSTYDDRYDDYVARLPQYVGSFHRFVEQLFNQLHFTLEIENEGVIQAENLVVSITAIEGVLSQHFCVPRLNGPRAPEPRGYLGGISSTKLFRAQVEGRGRHEMYLASDDALVSDELEWHCRDFRHGRLWSFDGFAQVDPRGPTPFAIEVYVTASNLRGEISRRFELPTDVRAGTVSELFDLNARQLRAAFRMQAQLTKAIANGNRAWFRYLNVGFQFPDEDSDEGDD